MRIRPLTIAALLLCAASTAEGAGCTIATSPVQFGGYNVFASAPTDSHGSVSYRCSGGAKNMWIAISRGDSPTWPQRTLAKGTERLLYNLFRDAARTAIWGDFSAGTSGYYEKDPPNNQTITVPVYGRIPAGQDVSAGAYSDSVSVTVNF